MFITDKPLMETGYEMDGIYQSSDSEGECY